MKSKKFAGLFEDEVSEEIRNAGRNCVIRSGRYEFRPACGVLEDGVYSDDTGLYLMYITGIRGHSYVGRGFIVRLLAHNDFEIEEVKR